MKIIITVKLYTDGDFYLDKNFEYEDNTIRDCGEYYIQKCFEETEPPHKSWKPESWMRYQAKDFLEETLTSLRFSSTHYYLMGDLCDFFDKAIRSINQLKIGECYEDSFSGNYEGTEIAIIFVKE